MVARNSCAPALPTVANTSAQIDRKSERPLIIDIPPATCSDRERECRTGPAPAVRWTDNSCEWDGEVIQASTRFGKVRYRNRSAWFCCSRERYRRSSGETRLGLSRCAL